MPNWCTNRMTIEGSKKDIDNFLEKHIVDGSFDFNTVIPEPQREEDCPDIFNLNKRQRSVKIQPKKGREWFNWYDWRLVYWGCKWNSSATYIDRISDSKCIIEYDTPWGNAEGIEDEITETHPELEITIEEDVEWENTLF